MCIIYKTMFENAMLMYSVFMITVYIHVYCFRGPKEDWQCQLGNPLYIKTLLTYLKNVPDVGFELGAEQARFRSSYCARPLYKMNLIC